MEKLLLKPKLLSRLFSKMPGYSNGKMFRCLAMLVIFALIGLLAGQLENHFSLVRKAWFALRSYSLVSFRFNTKSYEEYANFDGCLRNVTRVLIFVASAPVNFERRKALRLTWKNKNATKMTFTQPNSCKVKGNGHADVIFLIKFVSGYFGPKDDSFNRALEVENSQNKDLIFIDVEESYYNLGDKSKHMLRKANSFNWKFDFYVKCDDDVYLNLDLLARVLSQTHNENAYGGRCGFASQPERSPSNVFGLSKEVYPYNYFPPYCEGPMYYLSKDLVVHTVRISYVIEARERKGEPTLYRALSKFEDVLVGYYVFYSHDPRYLFRSEDKSLVLQPIPSRSMFAIYVTSKLGALLSNNFWSSTFSCRIINEYHSRVMVYHPVAPNSAKSIHECIKKNKRRRHKK